MTGTIRLLPGDLGTVVYHDGGGDTDFQELRPARVYWHYCGGPLFVVRHDAVAMDGKTFTPNLAGECIHFEWHRKGKWLSIETHQAYPYQKRTLHFIPGVQRFANPIF